MSKYYFAVRDMAYGPETGGKDEAGLTIEVDADIPDELVVGFAESRMPWFAGKLRRLSEEEYQREYGEDDEE